MIPSAPANGIRRAAWSTQHHTSVYFTGLLGWVTLCGLYGCTLKDYDYLRNGIGKGAGGTTHEGGDAGAANSEGGTGAEAGSTSTPLSEGGSGGDAGAGQGTSLIAGSGGEESSGCEPGFALCPGEEECIDLGQGILVDNTVTHCGSCGTTCSTTRATSATCDAGECAPACTSSYADCNRTEENDGCETDIRTVTDCGACGHACSDFGVEMVSCVDAECAPDCLPEFADCNVDDGGGEDDGCEVYLDDLTSCATTCEDGVACAPTEVCNTGVCGAPQGLVEFSVPFTSAGEEQRFGDGLPGTFDLENDTVVLRVYAPGATGGRFMVYLQDGDWLPGPGVTRSLSALSDGWTDIEFPVTSSADFDASRVIQVTMELVAGDAGPWANPTLLYVDGIRSLSSEFNDTFDTSLDNMVSSSAKVVQGSTMTWMDAMPEPGAGGAPGAGGTPGSGGRPGGGPPGG